MVRSIFHADADSHADNVNRCACDTPVYFGYETALAILRSVDHRALSPAKGKWRSLPTRAPGKHRAEAAIGHLESTYPNLSVSRPLHVLVNNRSKGRTSDGCEPHMCSSDLAGTSFYRLAYDIYTSSPALSFIQKASLEKDTVSLLELGYEMCGTYQTWRTEAPSRYQVPALLSVRTLENYLSRNPSINGAARAARMIRYLADGSASARETKQALILGLPMSYGGQGLGIPHMNHTVPASEAARAISGKASFRCDLCWPEHKLDVEYQSRECHEGEESRLADSRRTNALMSMGWTVVGVTNSELDSIAATETIAQTIRQHLGKRRQVRTANHHAKMLKLGRRLGLPARYE